MVAETIPYRFSVEDFHRMAEVGILDDAKRTELLDGEVVSMAPIGTWHAFITGRLTRLLIQGLGDRAVVNAQNPVLLGEHSELQPDIMVLRPPEERYRDRHPTATDCYLLVEVADSSAQFDRRRKLPLYARHGVTEVWLIDRQARRVELYRQPDRDARCYNWRRIRKTGEISPAAFADLGIEIATLL